MKYRTLLLATTLLLLTGLSQAQDSSSEENALNLHNGYWVTKVDVPNRPLKMTVINDMHVDPITKRATVYAQTRVLGQIMAPAQVGPGECTETRSGDTACFHPNAVYLNGSGQELMEADGTGSWWVKHSWIVDGEGYNNCEMKLAETYDDCFWVEGVLLDDGLSMKIGGTDSGLEAFYNVRTLFLEESPVRYSVTRYGPKNTDPEMGEIDLSPTAQFELIWKCEEQKSAFDNQMRSCGQN